jgi:hypothetical protein
MGRTSESTSWPGTTRAYPIIPTSVWYLTMLLRWACLIFFVSTLMGAQTCPQSNVNIELPVPTLAAVDTGSTSVSGTVARGASGTVQLCVDGKPQSSPQTVQTDGTFTIAVAKLGSKQKIIAQFISSPGGGAAPVFGSPSAETLVGSCSQNASKTSSSPTIPTLSLTIDAKNMASYQGAAPGATTGTVRVCLNDSPIDDSPVKVDSSGKFVGASALKVSAGDKIAGQFSSSGASPYGPVGNQVSVSAGPLQVGGQSQTSTGSSKVILIGGVEQSGYSSLGQNTNPFVNAFIEGPDNWINGWGRLRLLSAPQPSTQGIVSTFTDPTGQLTTQDYSKVGEALDFVIGPQLRPWKSKRWALTAGFGLTTPLNSQTVALTYAAPAPNTQECTTLTSRFTVQNGYAPGVTAAPPGSTTCLAGGYTDVAFSNQDRSSFLLKYGAGFRTSNTFSCKTSGTESGCADSYGVLDLTFGQDESVTRGMLRHVVFKMDGILPIPMGNASYVYLFGSAYIRLAKNQDLSPLILQTASAPTLPSPTTIVLPLQIPDRDFYRLGVGLNLNQIFCKMFGSTCPAKTSSTAGGAAPASSKKKP